jgi:hypothetical protein
MEGVYLHELIEEEKMVPAMGPVMVEAQTTCDLEEVSDRLSGSVR